MSSQEPINQPVTIRAENAEWVRNEPLSLSAMVRDAIDSAMNDDLDAVTCDRRDGIELTTTSVMIRRRHQEFLSSSDINLSATIDQLIEDRRGN